MFIGFYPTAPEGLWLFNKLVAQTFRQCLLPNAYRVRPCCSRRVFTFHSNWLLNRFVRVCCLCLQGSTLLLQKGFCPSPNWLFNRFVSFCSACLQGSTLLPQIASALQQTSCPNVSLVSVAFVYRVPPCCSRRVSALQLTRCSIFSSVSVA